MRLSRAPSPRAESLAANTLLFEHYESATEIEYDGRLLVLDNILLRPKTMDYSALGLMESASVSAAVLSHFR